MKSIYWNLLELTRDSGLPHVEAAPLILQLLAMKKLDEDPRARGRRPFHEIILLGDVNKVSESLRGLFERMAELSSSPSKLDFNTRLLDRLSLPTVMRLLHAVDQVNSSDLSPDEALDFLREAQRKSGMGETVTPDIAEFMVRCAEVKAGETIYVPFDPSFNIAVKAALRGGEVFAEIRNSASAGLLHALNILFETRINVVVSDPIHRPGWLDAGKLRKFDNAVSAPPFGLRYREGVVDLHARFSEKTLYGEVLQVRHIQAQSQRQSVILVPNGLLFRTAAGEAEFKADLIRRGQVATIVALPPGLLDNTMIATSLLILRPAGQPSPVLFVNAGVPHFHEPGRTRGTTKLRNVEELVAIVTQRQETAYSRLVSPDEIERNEYNLQADRYALVEAQRQLEEVLSSAQTVPLEDLADLIRPQALKTDENEDIVSTFLEVASQDLGEDGYVGTPAKRLSLGRKGLAKAQPQLVQPEDILLVIKGGIGKVGLVPPDQPEPWLANQSFVIIRLKSNPYVSSPVVLMRYLASPIGQALLMKLAGGTSIPMLQSKDIRALPVMIASPAEQEAVIATDRDLLDLQSQIRSLQARAAELRQKHWGFQDEGGKLEMKASKDTP